MRLPLIVEVLHILTIIFVFDNRFHIHQYRIETAAVNILMIQKALFYQKMINFTK